MYLLILRDRFGNDSNSNVTNDVARDVRAQVLFAGASLAGVTVTPATQAVDELGNVSLAPAKESSHFTIAFTPKKCGAYRIGVGLMSESEVDDLIAQPSVGPAEVCWTEHTRLYADAESVDAGGEVFLQLACCDRFGNPSSVGIHDLACLSLKCVLRPPWAESRSRPATIEDVIIGNTVRHVSSEHDDTAASNNQHEQQDDTTSLANDAQCSAGVFTTGTMMSLPQEVGLFGATLVAKRTGSLHLSAFYYRPTNSSDVTTSAVDITTNNFPADISSLPSVACDEVITVEPGTVDWEKTTLLATNSVQTTVVGQVLTFGLILYDGFGNLVSPLQENERSHRDEPHKSAPQHQHHQAPRYDGITNQAVLMGESVSAPRGNASQRNHNKEEGRSSQDSLAGDHDEQQHHDDDDVETNQAAGGGGAPTASSASGRRVEDFEHQELPLLTVVCENNNHNDRHGVLSRHPEERKHTSLTAKFLVRPEWVAPLPQLALAAPDLHCSVFFQVTPTVAGVCQLRLVHRDSEVVLHAATEKIVTGPVVSGELLQPVPSTVRAGNVAAYHLKLRDEFGNWIVVDPAADMAAASTAAGAVTPQQQSTPLQKQLKLCVASVTQASSSGAQQLSTESTSHPGTTWAITQDDTSLALHVRPTIAETLKMRIVLAGSINREITVLPPLSVTPAPMHAPRCKWTLYNALPTVEQMQRPAPSSVSVAAGEELFASLAAFDRFGNVITDALEELTVESGGAAARHPLSFVTGTNGTSRPPVTVVMPATNATLLNGEDTKPASSHQVVYTLTPSERSTVSVSVTTCGDTDPAVPSVSTSDVVTVLPAPLHWPSCTVRLSDEQIVLGSSTNVIVQLRDRFLNPVEGVSAAFRVVVVHSPSGERYLVGPNPEHPQSLHEEHQNEPEGAQQRPLSDVEKILALPLLPDCEGFSSSKGKTLLCEVKPAHRGDLSCEVHYLPSLVPNNNHHHDDEHATKLTGTSSVN